MAAGVSGLLPEPSGYAQLLDQFKARVSVADAGGLGGERRAAGAVLVGRDILDRQEQARLGSRVIDRAAGCGC